MLFSIYVGLIADSINECLLVWEHLGLTTFLTQLNPPDEESRIIQSVSLLWFQLSDALRSQNAVSCSQMAAAVWNLFDDGSIFHPIWSGRNKSYEGTWSLRNQGGKKDKKEEYILRLRKDIFFLTILLVLGVFSPEGYFNQSQHRWYWYHYVWLCRDQRSSHSCKRVIQ